jgi:hypothetical protein
LRSEYLEGRPRILLCILEAEGLSKESLKTDVMLTQEIYVSTIDFENQSLV